MPVSTLYTPLVHDLSLTSVLTLGKQPHTFWLLYIVFSHCRSFVRGWTIEQTASSSHWLASLKYPFGSIANLLTISHLNQRWVPLMREYSLGQHQLTITDITEAILTSLASYPFIIALTLLSISLTSAKRGKSLSSSKNLSKKSSSVPPCPRYAADTGYSLLLFA